MSPVRKELQAQKCAQVAFGDPRERTAVRVRRMQGYVREEDKSTDTHLVGAHERASVCLHHLRQAFQADQPSERSCDRTQ